MANKKEKEGEGSQSLGSAPHRRAASVRIHRCHDGANCTPPSSRFYHAALAQKVERDKEPRGH